MSEHGTGETLSLGTDENWKYLPETQLQTQEVLFSQHGLAEHGVVAGAGVRFCSVLPPLWPTSGVHFLPCFLLWCLSVLPNEVSSELENQHVLHFNPGSYFSRHILN